MTREVIISGCMVLGGMVVCSILAYVFNRSARSERGIKLAALWQMRVKTWWSMAFVFTLAYFTHGVGSMIIFAFISFMLLREIITVTPTRAEDYNVLLSSFFLVLPFHYALLFINWYGLFVILIPVYAFLLVPTMIAATGSLENYFERTAKIQWALMLCIYCVGHAPALLLLKLEGAPFPNAPLLLFLVVVVQVRDTVAGIVNTVSGTHRTAVTRGPEWVMTWEGFFAGALAAAIAALLLAPYTLFSAAGAVVMAVVICIMCEAGNMCLVGLKHDWGSHGSITIEYHGAMIERIIPICFAAPVFFHLARYFCTGAHNVGFH